MKEKNKLKAVFTEGIIPKNECISCGGEGKVRSNWISGGFFSGGHYEYKKCPDCRGSGKNIWTCLTCKEKMYYVNGLACVNKNCEMYNLKVLLAYKEEV